MHDDTTPTPSRPPVTVTGSRTKRRPELCPRIPTLASALLLTLAAGRAAHATNFQVPAGLKGTLVFENRNGGDLSPVPTEFGLVQRDASGNPHLLPLTFNRNDDADDGPFYEVPVNGGEVFEFYIRRNAIAADPVLTPQVFSSDSTKNTAVDPVKPEHESTFVISSTSWQVTFELFNHTTDTESYWDNHYGDFFAYFQLSVRPACDNVTIMCPNPNVINSNHNTSVPSTGRDGVVGVQSGLGSGGPIVTITKTYDPKAEETCVKSRVDNRTWSFVQESIDFSSRRHESACGCGGCDQGGAFSGPDGLKQLEIRRIHRPKYDYMTPSSFGIGTFSEFDANLTIYPGAGGQQSSVSYFDPMSDAPPINFWELSPADNDNAIDGAYHDTATEAYRSLVFFDGTGAQQANPQLATVARLYKHNGESILFELINPHGGTQPTSLSGRLKEFRDRNGNIYTISYFFAATATDQDLAFDRQNLWLIQNVTDMYGVSASFAYSFSSFTNRHMIDFVQWFDGSARNSISYTYSPTTSTSGEEPDRLNRVVFPNGDASSFQHTWDATSQNWVLTYNDVAEGTSNHFGSVYVTGMFYVTPDGVTHNQPVGLVRKVMNGDNERVYQNWEDPNNTNTYYFSEGEGSTAGGQRLTRVKLNNAGATTEVARAQTIAADPTQAAFTVDESYVENGLGLPSQVVNGAAQATTLTRDATTGYITGVTTPDGKTVTLTLDTNKRLTKQVDQLGVTTNLVYDAAGNLLSATSAVGTARQAIWRYAYNAKGLLTSRTDPLGAVTDYAYDANSRVISITEPPDVTGAARAVRRFEYDVLGRRTAVVDQAGRRTSLAYDARGRLISATYPDGTTDQTIYGTGTLAGVVTTKVDRNGVTKAFTYDGTRRLIQTFEAANHPDSVKEVDYVFFPGRYIVSSENDDGTATVYGYDTRDRQISKTTYTTGTASLLTQKTWDAADRLTADVDPYNRKTYYVYDANSRVTRTVTEMVPAAVAAGTNLATLARITTANPKYLIEDQAWDAASRLISKTSPRGILTTFSYDELGRRTQLVEASGSTPSRTSTYQYDAANNNTRVVSPRATTAFTYTARGLQASKTEAFGLTEAATVSRTYSPTGRVATETDPRGGVTTFTYASFGDYVASVRDVSGFLTAMTLDPMGHVLNRTDPNGLVTTYVYDGRYRKTKETDGLNQSTFYTYDDDLEAGGGLDGNATWAGPIGAIGFGQRGRGHGVQVTDPSGAASLTVLDGVGRMVLTVDSFGNSTRTTYDTVTSGLLETSVTNPLGKVSKTRLDAAGQARQAVDPDGNVASKTYDASGNVLSVRDPSNVGKDCTYNSLNQQTACMTTLSETTAWIFDPENNVTSETDPKGNVRTCQYDGRNRKTSCTDRVGGVSSYTYDKSSNLLSVKDAQGGTTTYGYDARNLQTSIAYPDSSGSTDRVTLGYDAGQRLQTAKDQTANTLTMTYDGANRLTRLSYPDGTADTFGYDVVGRVTAASSARYGVTTSRGYDANGRVTSESTTIAGTSYPVAYAYDAASRLTKLTYPDGNQAVQSYGLNRDLVTGITFAGSTMGTYTYDAGSRNTKVTFGNGLAETRTYRAGDDSLSQISTTTVGALAYTYDHNGNKLTETGSAASGDQTLTYDKNDRLSNWVGPSLTQAWTLSLEGDWSSTSRNSVAEARTYNAAHELLTVATKAVTHDARGNLTQDDKGNKLVWDLRNRLQEYQKSGGVTVDYLYDAMGRKIARKVGTTLTTVYAYAGEEVVAEYKNGALAVDYVRGPGVDNLLASLNGGRLFWYSKDQLGSVKGVTDQSGAVVERYRYTAYGERTILSPSGAVLTASSPLLNNQVGFTGRPHDVDTGLIDFRSRQYDARLGRFVSRDSDYNDGLSLYMAYFVPNATDPTGEFGWHSLGKIASSVLHHTKGVGKDVFDSIKHVVDRVEYGVRANIYGNIDFYAGSYGVYWDVWAGVSYNTGFAGKWGLSVEYNKSPLYAGQSNSLQLLGTGVSNCSTECCNTLVDLVDQEYDLKEIPAVGSAVEAMRFIPELDFDITAKRKGCTVEIEADARLDVIPLVPILNGLHGVSIAMQKAKIGEITGGLFVRATFTVCFGPAKDQNPAPGTDRAGIMGAQAALGGFVRIGKFSSHGPS